jgi:hypothetical protein
MRKQLYVIGEVLTIDQEQMLFDGESPNHGSGKIINCQSLIRKKKPNNGLGNNTNCTLRNLNH